MTYKIPAASVIFNQFPEFTREDYPAFIKFVELYYDHINKTQVDGIGQDFGSIRNIDTTLDKFVNGLWKEFGINLPRTTDINDRHFLKHIKDFYSTKGSEESFRILFRHLYNTEVEIKYPKDQILIASDGKWIQDISIIVELSSGNIFDIIDQRVSISTSTQTIRVNVHKVRLLDDGNYEIFLDKFQLSSITTGSILTLNDISATVLGTISTVKVIKAGTGFYLGQLFTIPSALGTQSTIKVTKVGTLGELLEVQIIDFGSGYTLDFYAAISSGNTANIINSSILTSQTGGSTDSGFILSNYYADVEYTLGSYSGEVIREFYNEVVVPEGFSIDSEKTATLSLIIGPVRRYPGFYEDSSGFLSDSYYIQDGHYYQNFSYVISCIESLDTYKNIVKTLIHPSGFKLFGNQVLSNTLDMSSALQLINLYFQQMLLDVLDVIDANKYGLSKPIYDILSLAENEILAVSKPLDEALSISETITSVLSKTLTEALSVSEIEILAISKTLTDTASILLAYMWDDTYADIDYYDHQFAPIVSQSGSTYNITLTN